MLKIEIPMPTPSLNRLQRMHFHARTRLRNQYEQVIRLQMNQLNAAKSHQFRRVTIQRYGARLLDHDNFVGGCKPLLDALTRAGLLWDDSPGYLRVTYAQVSGAGKNYRTVLTIT